MSKVRWSLLGLTLALVCAVGTVRADDEKKKPDPPPRTGGFQPPGGGGFQPPGGFQPFPLGGFGQPLLSAKEMEELNLSDEQKGKVEKLVKEFGDKQKSQQEKIRDMMAKAREGGPDGFREVFGKVREVVEAGNKAREEAEAKLKEVLNDEQKKKFEEIKKSRPQQGGPGGFPGGGFGGRFTPGQILPPFMRDQLKLTDEQKKKLDDLQKKVKDELDKILTDEQKKQLERLRGPGGFPGGFPGGGFPGGPGGRPGPGDRPPSDF